MTLAAPPEALAPLQLPWQLRLTPEQFEEVCQANPDAVLELAADGELIAITPTGGETGQRNQTLGALLWLAVRQSALPLRLFDSSTGFRLPDGSVLCPDLVVELASPSDQGPRGVSALREKMELYRRNGAQLGWLLLPEEHAVEIWRAGSAPPERLVPAEHLSAAPLFPQLCLELREIWQL
jgi:Uma2 family endonuclease